METAVVRLSMPGGVGGQRRKPLPTRLTSGATGGKQPPPRRTALKELDMRLMLPFTKNIVINLTLIFESKYMTKIYSIR